MRWTIQLMLIVRMDKKNIQDNFNSRLRDENTEFVPVTFAKNSTLQKRIIPSVGKRAGC